jgi:hypothetical protein
MKELTKRQKFLLWQNRLRLSLSFQRKGLFVQLVVPERFRKAFRWTRYSLTTIGLILGFVAFKSVLAAGFLGIGLWLVSQFFEAAVFSYISLYVHPFPDFKVESEKWLGAVFGFGQVAGNPYDIPLVGMVLADDGYAKKISSLIRAWTKGALKDEEGNVCVSAIMDGDEYVFFCYPNPNKPSVQRFQEATCGFRTKVTRRFGNKLPPVSEQSYQRFRSESYHFFGKVRNGW